MKTERQKFLSSAIDTKIGGQSTPMMIPRAMRSGVKAAAQKLTLPKMTPAGRNANTDTMERALAGVRKNQQVYGMPGAK